MPLVKISRKEIVSRAHETFREKGYYNTSMQDLAEVCGLQKGSFYHHFASKEMMMLEVLRTLANGLKKEVFSIANERSLDPHTRMEKMLLQLGKVLLSKKGGCMVGNTSLETAGDGFIFQDTLKDIFQDWSDAMKSIFLEIYPESTARRLAESSIMEFEGAVMLATLHENEQYLKDVFVRTLAKMK